MAICFAAVPSFLRLGPDFLDNGSRAFLNGSPQIQHRGGVKADRLLSIFFSPTPKNWRGKKPQFSRTAVS